jgi:two-component system NtrC family sensor kinase
MRQRLSTKLIVGGGAASAIIIGLFVFLVVDNFQGHLVGDLETYAQQLSETVKSSTRYDMLLNQRSSVHEIINTIGRQEAIDRVRVYNKDGEIIYSSDSTDIGHLVDMQAEACYACHAEDRPLESLPISSRTRTFSVDEDSRLLGIINPIYNDASCWQSSCHAHAEDQKVLGVLDLTLPLDEVDRQRRAGTVMVVALAIVVMVAISLIIFYLARRFVLRPVELLVEATQRVAAGDLSTSVPVRSQDEVGQLAESFNEMTHRLAEAQRHIFRSSKLASVGRLAAGVAHELNNPLTGVLTYGSFLLNQTQDPELKKDLEVVVRETKRCRDIVAGLLDFSRQTPSAPRWTDINEVIHVASGMVRHHFALQKTRLVLDLQQDLPPVNIDPSQMQQVLVNLLVNAADAMPKEGGSVTVTTTPGVPPPGRPGPAVQLEVSDTGQGIPEEHLDKIFDPFFTTKGTEGTGLGLAIVWGIIEEHGGDIQVATEPGKGTRFTIRLPARERVPPVAETETELS